MVLAKGNAESNKPLLLFVKFMSLRAFLVIPLILNSCTKLWFSAQLCWM